MKKKRETKQRTALLHTEIDALRAANERLEAEKAGAEAKHAAERAEAERTTAALRAKVAEM